MSESQKPAGASVRYADRTGRCSVANCACDVFEYRRYLDGFVLCACTHTQVSHLTPETEGTIDS